MLKFITKHQGSVSGALSGFDRVRFRGTIRRLAYVDGVMGLLSFLSVLLKDFVEHAKGLTAGLQRSVEEVAAAANRTIRYLQSSTMSKEGLVRELIRREGLTDGLVCVLSCVEPCRSYDVRRDAGARRIELVPSLRKCLHWYVYFLDPMLGLCHVRIQSWLPFSVTVCVNGRERLCRSLTAAGIGFEQRDNSIKMYDKQGSVTTNGHRSRGLHPLTETDANLAELLQRGEFAINGFRNRDLRKLLFPGTTDEQEIRRQSGQVGRLLRIFKDHGLIHRVKGTHRHHVSAEGRRTLPAFLAARNSSTTKLLDLAA